MQNIEIWDHGTKFTIRRVETGGYSINGYYDWCECKGSYYVYPNSIPKLVTFRISVDGRLVDSALSLSVAKARIKILGKHFLTKKDQKYDYSYS